MDASTTKPPLGRTAAGRRLCRVSVLRLVEIQCLAQGHLKWDRKGAGTRGGVGWRGAISARRIV